MKQKTENRIAVVVSFAFTLLLLCGCGTMDAGSVVNQVNLGDGRIFGIEVPKEVYALGFQAADKYVRENYPMLYPVWRSKFGGQDQNKLGGFDYVTTYEIVKADGTRVRVPDDAQIVAVDTPVPPTLPQPRIRTLSVKEIAPKIVNASDPVSPEEEAIHADPDGPIVVDDPDVQVPE